MAAPERITGNQTRIDILASLKEFRHGGFMGCFSGTQIHGRFVWLA